jgi:hypothetical protein
MFDVGMVSRSCIPIATAHTFHTQIVEKIVEVEKNSTSGAGGRVKLGSAGVGAGGKGGGGDAGGAAGGGAGGKGAGGVGGGDAAGGGAGGGIITVHAMSLNCESVNVRAAKRGRPPSALMLRLTSRCCSRLMFLRALAHTSRSSWRQRMPKSRRSRTGLLASAPPRPLAAVVAAVVVAAAPPRPLAASAGRL